MQNKGGEREQSNSDSSKTGFKCVQDSITSIFLRLWPQPKVFVFLCVCLDVWLFMYLWMILKQYYKHCSVYHKAQPIDYLHNM